MRSMKALLFILLLGCSFLVVLLVAPPAPVFATAAPSLDGTQPTPCSQSPGTSCTITFAPSGMNDLLIVEEAAVVSGGGTTPTCTTCGTNGPNFIALQSEGYLKDYYLVDTASTSTTVTCKVGNSAGFGCLLLAIKGEDPNNPFDPNGGCKALSNTCSVTTSIANDYVFGAGEALCIGDCTPSISINSSYTLIEGPQTFKSGSGVCTTYACGTLEAEGRAFALTRAQTVSFTMSGDGQYIIGEAVEPPVQVVFHIQFTIQTSGSAATFTVGGSCGANDSTVAGDGAVHGVLANPSCAVSFSTTPLSTSRYYFNSSSATVSYNTCSAPGPCPTLKYKYWYQVSNTYEITNTQGISFSSGLTALTIAGTSLGSAVTCTITTSSHASPSKCSTDPFWTDDNVVVNGFTNPLANPPDAYTRWQSSSACSFTPTSGGNTENCVYYEQFLNTPAIQTVDTSYKFNAGLTALTITATQFGVTGQGGCTITFTVATTDICSSTQWEDRNTPLAGYTSPTLAGAATGTQYYIWPTGCTTSMYQTSGNNQPTCKYYYQYTFEARIAAKPDSWGYFVGSMSAPITGSSLGISTTICTIYTTSNATDRCPTPTGYVAVDAGHSIYFPGTLSGAVANTKWCNAAGCLQSSAAPTIGPNVYAVNYWFETSDNYYAQPTNAAADYVFGTTTITFTGMMQNSPATVCSGNAGGTTSVCSGYTDFGSTVTATATLADGANKQWATSTTNTASVINVNYYYYYYLQVQNTCSITPINPTMWDSGRTIIVQGEQTGDIATLCTFTPSGADGVLTQANIWSDYNEPYLFRSSTGGTAGTAWVPNPLTSSNRTVGGQTINSNYTLFTDPPLVNPSPTISNSTDSANFILLIVGTLVSLTFFTGVIAVRHRRGHPAN